MLVKGAIKCKHCGDDCKSETIAYKDYSFCCNGCQIVFQILSENGLTRYYELENYPGNSFKNSNDSKYEYLDDEELQKKMLTFLEGNISKIKLYLPQIHCSSCLWLLENIDKLNVAIYSSKVNFIKKEAVFQFDNSKISFREVVELLSKIGYPPRLQFDQIDENKKLDKTNRSLIYRIGLAGFSFGNIMLLSFPEYLGFERASIHFFVGYINLILIIPVLLFSANEYFKSALLSLKIGQINLDLPIVIGMLTLFIRSAYEILSGTGEGYLDSLAGFVFFLLIGKWFQSSTYKKFDFDRSYTSYFPISASYKINDKWNTKSIDKLISQDILLIRNGELIPTDSKLLKGKGRIDYSFVTGESELISKSIGDELFAGGKQVGESIEVVVLKKVNQSKLTQLWNDQTFKHKVKSKSDVQLDFISKYFTLTILAISVLTFIFWQIVNPLISYQTFTSVLIVACPCALALAIPFAYGNIVRLLSQNSFYLRNIDVIKDLQDVDHIVFDKTGTITDSSKIKLSYEGKTLSLNDLTFIKSSCMHSSHPLSKAIVDHLTEYETIEIDFYKDALGYGFESKANDDFLKLGSESFIFGTEAKSVQSGVFILINNEYKGHFKFEHQFRFGLSKLLSDLSQNYKISLLSGDSDKEKKRVIDMFGGNENNIKFNQTPLDKLNFIRKKQSEGERILMIGDGLNDAGALKQAHVGFVISDACNNFSPACDGILSADSFHELLSNIKLIKKAKFLIYMLMIVALLYNVIGLSFAITGNLRPIVAAILMPLSSITVVLFGVFGSWVLHKIYIKK